MKTKAQAKEAIRSICKCSAQTFKSIAEKVDDLPFLEWRFTANEIRWEAGKTKDIRKADKANPFYTPLFKKMEDMGLKKCPVLYYFSIESKFDYDEFTSYYLDKLTSLGALAKGNGKRNLSALRLRDDAEKCLYCGKVIKDFDLRMVVHLGYEKNGLTWGLQLSRWLPQKYPDMKLSLKAFVFPEEMARLMGALEYQMANTLKPIIGKHS